MSNFKNSVMKRRYETNKIERAKNSQKNFARVDAANNGFEKSQKNELKNH